MKADPTDITKTIVVDISDVRATEKFLKKMARRGAKIGQQLNWAWRGEEYDKPCVEMVEVMTMCGHIALEPRRITRTVRDLKIFGTLPRLDGWSVVAVLKYENAIPTVHATTEKIPKRFLAKAAKSGAPCEHCKTKRARKTIFILKKGQRTYRAIGSTCVKDFTGWDGDLAAVTRWHKAISGIFGCEIDPDFAVEQMGWGGRLTCYNLEDFCTLTAYAIRTEGGYVSRRAAEASITDSQIYDMEPKIATVDIVSDLIRSALGAPKDLTGADRKVGKAAIRAGRKISAERRQNEDIMQNMWAVASGDALPMRRSGLAAWLVAWHQREKAKRAAAARKARGGRWCGVSDHVGTIGKREDWRVKVVGRRVTSGFYGETLIFEMVTESGDKLVWFCSGDSQGLKEGGIFTLKGTVKRHVDFRDEKQTTINRCKVITTT